jgi:DNA-binding ferritin-like protein
MVADGRRRALDTRAERVIDLLDKHLAAAIDLQLRIKHVLWNAEDPQITETWWLNDAASEFEMFCEVIAERIHSLIIVAQAASQNIQARSFLDPTPSNAADEWEGLSAILRDVDQFQGFARQAAANAADDRDEATANLFTWLVKRINAQIWFLGCPPRYSNYPRG